MNCPHCSRRIRSDVRTCKHCKRKVKGATGLILGAIACVLLVAGTASAAVVLPRMNQARKQGNQAAARGALLTITTAQSLFREGDKERDSNFDYGSLRELAAANLVDGVLGEGAKQGYLFEAAASPTTSEFLWYATATPAEPGTTGDLYFGVNQYCEVYASEHPIEVDPQTCKLSGQDLRPVTFSFR